MEKEQRNNAEKISDREFMVEKVTLSTSLTGDQHKFRGMHEPGRKERFSCQLLRFVIHFCCPTDNKSSTDRAIFTT